MITSEFLLGILDSGSEEWNRWRELHSDSVVIFGSLDLSERKFEGFNFNNSYFIETRLNRSSFTDCTFDDSILKSIQSQGSYWRNVRFRHANISGDFSLSRWYAITFDYSTVENAGFPFAEMRYLKLEKSRFSGHFADTDVNSWTLISTDLSGLSNASGVNVEYPFNIDGDTLKKTLVCLSGVSAVHSIEIFLTSCGVSKEILSTYNEWSIGPNMQQLSYMYSCFISYSHLDKDFAKILQERLKKKKYSMLV